MGNVTLAGRLPVHDAAQRQSTIAAVADAPTGEHAPTPSGPGRPGGPCQSGVSSVVAPTPVLVTRRIRSVPLKGGKGGGGAEGAAHHVRFEY